VIYTVPFESGSTLLSTSAKVGIKKARAQLADTPTIILDAYAETDGDERRNLALTTARANVVQDQPPHKVLIRMRGDRVFEQAGLAKQGQPSRRVELLALS
jgi:OmpA family